MKIDYIKFQKRSKRQGVSVYLLLKRHIGYRLSKPGEFDCRLCLHQRFIGFEKQRMQCHIIGESLDFYSDVDSKHICNCFEKMERREPFDYTFYLFAFDEEKN